MVRKITKEDGFTLIELIVVVSIMAIILMISIPFYTKWKTKMSVEGDTKKIYGVLQMFREKAFAEKKSYLIKLSGKVLYVCDTNDCDLNSSIYKLNLNNEFDFIGDNDRVSIDIRGTFHGSSVYAKNYASADAQYDCVAVDDIRIRLGKFSGGKCEAK